MCRCTRDYLHVCVGVTGMSPHAPRGEFMCVRVHTDVGAGVCVGGRLLWVGLCQVSMGWACGQKVCGVVRVCAEVRVSWE